MKKRLRVIQTEDPAANGGKPAATAAPVADKKAAAGGKKKEETTPAAAPATTAETVDPKKKQKLRDRVPGKSFDIRVQAISRKAYYLQSFYVVSMDE